MKPFTNRHLRQARQYSRNKLFVNIFFEINKIVPLQYEVPLHISEPWLDPYSLPVVPMLVMQQIPSLDHQQAKKEFKLLHAFNCIQLNTFLASQRNGFSKL